MDAIHLYKLKIFLPSNYWIKVHLYYVSPVVFYVLLSLSHYLGPELQK